MAETVTVTYTRDGKTFTASTTVTDPPSVMGWQRTKQNTGLAAVGVTSDMLTPYTGPLSIPAGTRLYRKLINAGTAQLLMNSGVVLEQCEIHGKRLGPQGLIWIKDGSGQKIINCDLYVEGVNEEIAGIYANAANDVEIRSLYQQGGSIGMWFDTVSGAKPSTVSDWWYGLQPTGGGAHRDGFTRRSGNVMVTLDSVRIDIVKYSATGAIFTQPTWGGTVGGLTVKNSYLLGAGYVIGLDRGYDSHFINNRITPTEYGATSLICSGPWTWSENYYYDASKPDGKGAPIPSPI
jgi:hypothetical protein